MVSMRPPASADPALNSRLATALQRAKEQGLTKQGIENAMSRVSAFGGKKKARYMSLYLFRQEQWQKGQDKVSFTKL